jgi:putative DNA primase/helicase
MAETAGGVMNPDDVNHEPPLETRVARRPLFPPPSAPLDVARKLYSQYRIGGNGMRTLLAWRGGWMHWETTHWSELDVAHLRSEIYDTLGEADYKHPIREKGITVDYEIRP